MENAVHQPSPSSTPEPIPEDYGRFCRGFRMRLKERWVHPRAFEFWPACAALDRTGRDELLALQRKRLAELLDEVVVHVPYYRRWAKQSGWRPGDAIRLADLPVVSKADYRRELESFISDAYAPGMIGYGHTSGSTGEPFRFGALKGDNDYNYCVQWRGMARFGLRPGDRRVLVWGYNPGYGQSAMRKRWSGLKKSARDHFNSTLTIDAHLLDHRNAGAAVDRIDGFAATYLHGYVSPLYTLARHLADSGRQLRGLKAVVTDSEKLYDFQLQAMRQAFGCPILEQYGCLEVGLVAARDPVGIMRINEDQVIVERLDDGQAVLTSLTKRAFPFIRYSNGDMIELDERVAPGLPYASLASVAGRSVDRIQLPHGGFVHGFVLAYAVSAHVAYVRRYQIHQTALDQFTVRCVVSSPLPRDVREQIIRNFQKAVGAPVHVRIEEVDHIPTTSTGKFRWVISDVPQQDASSGVQG